MGCVRGKVRIRVKGSLHLHMCVCAYVCMCYTLALDKVGMWFVCLPVVAVVHIDPGEFSNMRRFSALDLAHAPQSFRLNAVAPLNIADMSVTLDTSHLEMSPLNDNARACMLSMVATLISNNPLISVT